jgi:Protein of unknown function (DUF2652)
VDPRTARGDRPSRSVGTLVLADISGYTSFLQGVADAHRPILDVDEPPIAYTLMSSLLDAIVANLAPPFRLAKLEGDAVFVFAADPDLEVRGADVLRCLRACYAAFRSRLDEARALWTCTCIACAMVSTLDLKFVVHHGEYVIQAIVGREELLGPAVNAVHRLLKNHATELIGPRPYALLSDQLLSALAVPTEGMIATTESYPDVPPIPAHILPLEGALPPPVSGG